MPVNKDGNRRWVEVSAEVPGTPEEVWRAIATGPGISSWFVPYTSDERVGGQQIGRFGPDENYNSYSTITSWEPPHRFSADSKDDLPDDGPTMATEWTVEAKSGETCIVRVVHSLVTDRDDWDQMLQMVEFGWPGYFKNLRLVLTHFRDQPVTFIEVALPTADSKPDAWRKVVDGLGFHNLETNAQVEPQNGAPPFTGKLQDVGPAEYPEHVMALVSDPAPGIGSISVYEFATTMVYVRFYLFGPAAPEAGLRADATWRRWLEEHLTPVTEPQPA